MSPIVSQQDERSMLTRTLLAIVLATAASAPALAQDYHGKLTVSTYDAAGDQSVDVNARYTVGDWTGWLGYYGAQDGTEQGRGGIEYDWHHQSWLFLVPSMQVASRGFLGGTLYAEIGTTWYAIAGISRTDLRPYANLTFDPNDSWQLGAGFHFGKSDSIALYTIWDNRLDTGQQITHAVLRRHFAKTQRITLDVSYKSGHGDNDVYLRGDAEAVEYDWSRWFVKAAHDRHANFSEPTMWRFGGGFRF
jgi:hypothetical protein